MKNHKKVFTPLYGHDKMLTDYKERIKAMLNKLASFAAEYFYFYFTYFFKGKVNFAAMG